MNGTLVSINTAENSLNGDTVTNNFRPVFTLKSGIKIKGEGTEENPYTLVE